MPEYLQIRSNGQITLPAPPFIKYALDLLKMFSLIYHGSNIIILSVNSLSSIYRDMRMQRIKKEAFWLPFYN